MDLFFSFYRDLQFESCSGKWRGAKYDSVHGIVPIQTGEKCQRVVQTVPFRCNMPIAVDFDFLTSGYDDLEQKKKVNG